MQTPLLFAEEQLPWQPAYDAGAVRERLETVLVKMRAAANWPWKAATVEFYRATLWPSLLSKLSATDDTARLRSEMQTEMARLDAAA